MKTLLTLTFGIICVIQLIAANKLCTGPPACGKSNDGDYQLFMNQCEYDQSQSDFQLLSPFGMCYCNGQIRDPPRGCSETNCSTPSEYCVQINETYWKTFDNECDYASDMCFNGAKPILVMKGRCDCSSVPERRSSPIQVTN